MKRTRSQAAGAVGVGDGGSSKERRTVTSTALGIAAQRRGHGADAGNSDKAKNVDGMVAGGVFHPVTGALSRTFETFRDTKEKRGFGLTKALDDHPYLIPHISIAIGPTGSGKTSVLLNELAETLRYIHPKRLGKVMVYSGSPQDDLMKRLDPDVIDFYGPEQQEGLLSALRQLHLDSLGEQAMESEKPLNILMLDDAGVSGELMPTQIKNSEMAETFVRHRHIPITILAAGQRFNMLNVFLRSNAMHIYNFPSRSKGEAEEVVKCMDLPQEVCLRTMRAVADDPHQFIWFDRYNRTGKIGFNQVFVS